MDSIEEENNRILIVRYLSGEASPEEVTELNKWLGASGANLLYFQQVKNIWYSSNRHSLKDLSDTNKAFKEVNKRITLRSPGFNFWTTWKKIAAILIIPLILGNLLYFLFLTNNNPGRQEPVYNELFAAFGTRSALKLSDGTSVWLNSGSSIKYPDKFIDKDRKVFLNGEAYFEVESNPEKPFIVETSSIKVRATGTKFNVLGYSSINENEVTLVSGKVEVGLPCSNDKFKSTNMEINQHLTFDKNTGAVTIVNEDTYKYISWKEGKLVFRNEPLTEVAKKISQVFNIDIEIRGKEIENYSYRATFQDESLAEILKLLKISSPINYYEIKRNPLPDGSFPRKKVIIYPAGKKGI
ncbi:MAG: FecR family protein [Bacteroidales bacterium]|nr:FecR family protein [Bacteroidales bacterium]MBK8882111.1 FecR family protein [Bacteroidales bacterium]